MELCAEISFKRVTQVMKLRIFMILACISGFASPTSAQDFSWSSLLGMEEKVFIEQAKKIGGCETASSPHIFFLSQKGPGEIQKIFTWEAPTGGGFGEEHASSTIKVIKCSFKKLTNNEGQVEALFQRPKAHVCNTCRVCWPCFGQQ